MTRVVLYTDEAVLEKGLEAVLGSADGFELCRTARLAQELAAAVQGDKPDVVLVDFTPDLSFSLLVELQRLAPGTRIVLWVRSISTELAYQAMEHGVCGVLKRTQPVETLLKCLRVVAEGGMWFDETLKTSFNTMRAVALTRRESQLVSLLAQGLKNKEIATALFISEGTVKVYLSRLFHKLGVKDRFELALFGLKNMPAGGGPVEVFQPQPPRRNAQRAQEKPAGLLRSLVVERPPVKVPGRAGDLFD
jgi:DNA-binding NarL/FixJ family response regulator